MELQGCIYIGAAVDDWINSKQKKKLAMPAE